MHRFLAAAVTTQLWPLGRGEHLTLNLRHQWSCSRCKAHHSVRTRAKGPLSKECKGDRKKGGQKPSPAPRFSSAQGFAALFANQVPTKSKGKAKAKPKANSVAGLLSVASFFKTNYRYGGRRPKQRPWHKPSSLRRGEKACQAGECRVAEGLASKSTGSVSRSKARALAHRASIDSKFIPVTLRCHGVVLELAKTAPPSSDSVDWPEDVASNSRLSLGRTSPA